MPGNKLIAKIRNGSKSEQHQKCKKKLPDPPPYHWQEWRGNPWTLLGLTAPGLPTPWLSPPLLILWPSRWLSLRPLPFLTSSLISCCSHVGRKWSPTYWPHSDLSCHLSSLYFINDTYYHSLNLKHYGFQCNRGLLRLAIEGKSNLATCEKSYTPTVNKIYAGNASLV